MLLIKIKQKRIEKEGNLVTKQKAAAKNILI